MERDYPNIYKSARQTAGLTQERWAEVLGLSPDAIRQYETGRITPSDEVALRMAEVAGQHIICYWHLLQKSRVAAQLFPEVERMPLSMAVIHLLLQLKEFEEKQHLDELLKIAQDGRVDQDEAQTYAQILRSLDGVVQAALAVRFARQDEEG